jgi:hypothetical protein
LVERPAVRPVVMVTLVIRAAVVALLATAF